MVLPGRRIDLSKTMPDPTSAKPDLDAMLAHSGWVRALARSLVADPDLADDIEQQTWLTAMRRPPRDDRNLRSWLGSVVRSMAGMHWRESDARRRRELVVADRREEEMVRHAESARPESLSERMETFRELAAAVAELEEPYGTSVYLRYFEELSVREVARRTQVPIPTAQSRINRGVQKMRARMLDRLGKTWHQRCLVFTLPLAKAPWWGAAAILTMTLKTKLLLSAAALALLSLFIIEPWATDPAELEQEVSLAAAEYDSGSSNRFESSEPIAKVERGELLLKEGNAVAAVVETDKQLTFHVLDAVSLEPAPDAEVWYFDHATDPDEEWRYVDQRDYLDVEQLVQRFGKPANLESDASLNVSFPEGYAMIIARRGDTFAYKFHHPSFYHDGEEHELLLKPVRTQEVRVVDQNGHPLAGIEVHFCPEPASDAAHAREKVITDASGLATFRHLELVLREDHPDWKNTVAVPIPGVEPAYVERTASQFGDETIEFVVPPTGEVHVTCVNGDGSFVPDGTPVFFNGRDGSGGSYPNAYLRKNALIRYTRNGLVVMPRVGVGKTVIAYIQVRGANSYRGKGILGPEYENDVVEAELILGPAPETLTMKVVDAEGLPPSSGFYTLFVEAVSEQGEQGGLGHSMFLGEEGLLEFTLPEELHPEAHLLRMLLHSQEAEPMGTSSFALIELDIEEETPSEVLEIRFGEEVIVGGILQDDNGDPIVATRMILRVHDKRVEANQAGSLISYQHVRTDSAGRFQFRGPAPSEFLDYSLHLPSPGFNDNWGEDPAVEFHIGQSDLRVIMERTTDLKGRLLVSNPEILPMIEIRGVVEEGEGRRSFLKVPIEVPNGRFTKEGVSLASTEFQLIARDGGRVLEKITIAAEKAGDFTWDLRESLFLHHLTLQGPQRGEDLEAILNLPQHRSIRLSCSSGEQAGFLARHANLRYSVGVLGYRSQDVVSDGHAEVFLNEGIVVTLAVPDGVAFPDDVRWRMILRHFTYEDAFRDKQDHLGFEYDFIGSSVWQEGLTLRLPKAGVWVAEITPVTERFGMTFLNHARIRATPKGMEVVDQVGGQSFQLDIKQEILDALAESARPNDD
ncbi:MAG: sigma-70 family RNA polymerase sigma factor [Planctomycetota bacterium]